MTSRPSRRARRLAAAKLADRIEHVCAREFRPHKPWGGTWSEVTAWTLGDDGWPLPDPVVVHTPVGRLDRARFEAEMNRWTGRRWRYDWHDPAGAAEYGRLYLRPGVTDLRVPYPPHLMVPLAEGIPLGATLDGELVCWNPGPLPGIPGLPGAAPHMGVSGSTGTGKSVLLAAIGLGVLVRGAQLDVVDYPKGTNFRGFKHHARVARTLDEGIQLLEEAWQLAGSRYEMAWDTDLSMPEIIEADGGERFVIVDEFGRWRPNRGEDKHVAARLNHGRDLVNELLGAVRQAGVHLVIGTPQLNADLFGSTEARSNVKFTAAFWQEPEGARQARLPDAAHLDPAAIGRAKATLEGHRVVEFQGYWLPDAPPDLRHLLTSVAGERMVPARVSDTSSSYEQPARPSRAARSRRPALDPGGDHAGGGGRRA